MRIFFSMIATIRFLDFKLFIFESFSRDTKVSKTISIAKLFILFLKVLTIQFHIWVRMNVILRSKLNFSRKFKSWIIFVKTKFMKFECDFFIRCWVEYIINVLKKSSIFQFIFFNSINIYLNFVKFECRRRDLTCLRDCDCERWKKTYEKTKDDSIKFENDDINNIKNKFISTITIAKLNENEKTNKINEILKVNYRLCRLIFIFWKNNENNRERKNDDNNDNEKVIFLNILMLIFLFVKITNERLLLW